MLGYTRDLKMGPEERSGDLLFLSRPNHVFVPFIVTLVHSSPPQQLRRSGASTNPRENSRTLSAGARLAFNSNLS